MFQLKNKTAVITGGGSGIGKAIAFTFAKQGAYVFILDLDQAGGQATADEIIKTGGKADFKKCNVALQAEVKQVVENIVSSNGSINILINNAGIAHVGNAENTGETDFDRLIQVNIKGMYNCLHEIIPYMKKSGGTIINMASVAATVGIPDRFAYSMTKGAVVGMTLSFAKDYIHQNIR